MFEFVKTVEKLEIVPKDFRGLYAVGDDEKFHLRTDDPGITSAVSAIMGYQKALGSERSNNADLKKKQVDLGPLAEYGDDPTGIAESITAKLAEMGKGKKSAEDVQAAVKSAVEEASRKHTGEKEAWGTREGVLLGTLRGQLVTSEARAALAEAGAVKADLVLPFIEKQVTVVEENGQFFAQVLAEDGKTPRFNGTGAAPMSVRDLVTEMKEQEEYGPLFKSDKLSGGGTKPTNGRPMQSNTGDLSPTQKISQGLANR